MGFRFGGNLDNTRHTPRSETAINTKTKEQTISQDNTSITINTITNLLKQLQELTDKEKELLNKKEEESTKENANNRRSISECRRKSRPQILMKKMKCMLSASNLGMKNDNSLVEKTSGTSQTDIENNQVSDLSRNSINSLRLDKLQIAKQTLNVVDGLRGNIC